MSMNECPASDEKVKKIKNLILFKMQIWTSACRQFSPNLKNKWSLISNYGVRMDADICSFIQECPYPFLETQTNSAIMKS